MEKAYVAEAQRMIDGYRGSQRQTTDFDWHRAQTVLEHAQELDPANVSITGKLQLAKGYVDLNAAGSPQSSGWQEMETRVTRSYKGFQEAATRLPKAPDPHLGLARLWVYSYRDLGKAIDEWDKAEQLGYALGPREIEQKADGFRLRAQKEWNEMHDRAAASHDLAQAKSLFQTISNYDDVPQYLRLVAQAQRSLNPPPPAPAPRTLMAKASHANRAHQKGRAQAWQSPKAGKKRKS